MIKAWIATHKSLSMTAISSILVAAVIITGAVVSDGYTAHKLNLGDAAVWVTSQTKQLLGRANTEIRQLNSVVAGGGHSLDVVQSAKNVLLIDHGSNTVGVVDPATAEVGRSVPLPARSPAVALAGKRVAITSEGTGQLWLTQLEDLRNFDARTPATVNLGGKIVSATDPTGRFFAYSAGTDSVYRIDAATSDEVTETDRVRLPDSTDDVSISAVGGRWALLDNSASRVVTSAGTRALPKWLGAHAVIQQPSDSGNDVFVASATGLVAVPLDSGPVRTVLRAELGVPATPAVMSGCVYAAWAGGTAWSSCDSSGTSSGTRTRLPGIPASPSLAFRANGDDLVLNDTVSGRAWAVQHGNALIDNWTDFAHHDNDKQKQEEDDRDTPPTYEKDQQPPVAVDDVLGARPGKVSSLPVLLNDFDPNGDVLVISSFAAPASADGTIDLVNNDQQLQLTLPPNASASLQFHYTVTDGHGGTATALVTVHVRTPDENSPPVQARATKATVTTGGRITTLMLGDWYDPDGDPIYLSSATADPPDSVSYTPEGSVVYSDAGAGGSLKNVALVVSDGTAAGSGAMAVTVHDLGTAPIIAEQFVLQATAGTEISVAPLPHVRSGAGQLRLSAVATVPDAAITPDYDSGTFRFSSESVGTHLIDYAITDGVSSGNGIVRIEVKPPPTGKTMPIAVPHTAFIHEQSSREIDVLATDIDPAGGVLLVTEVSSLAPASGIRVEVLQQHLMRITLTRPIEAPISFNYRISNGLADAQGTVTVVQIPRPALAQPPVANPDSVSVRVGDAIDIPVLANDQQPDGDELTLAPNLAKPLPAGAGLLFASGTVLRYLAPTKPGNYTATYRVNAADGQWATAAVTIAVRELDAATNNPPVPQTVTARVLAGGAVRIPIPLNGIDPDGDSVKLVGQATNPDKGAVSRVDSDSILYQAGEYSTGLDTFDYSVVDALGARATGTVRVGIAAEHAGARNPVAVEDEVSVRPSRTVSVQVLANDSDPDNSPLKITSLTPSTTSAAKARIVGDLVKVKAPKTPGRYGFVYEIRNQTGGSSANFLTVVVAKDAPLARPEVRDTVLGLSDILGKRSVNVDVLANVFFADGPVGSLKVKVFGAYVSTAQVNAQKQLRVQVRPKSQVIPFSVTHPDDDSIVSYGFVWVPGTDDALPQLRSNAPKLKVPSESALTIHLNDYVVAVAGKRVRLTDSSTVHATHSNGDNLVADGQSLTFKSAAHYFGPASISFEVTDGTSASEPKGRVATLVLAITVTPRENQPPVFTGGQVDFEPGQSKMIDLVKLTRYPYGKDQKDLSFRVLEPRPDSFTLSQDGTRVKITASENAKSGVNANILIGVRVAASTGQSGRIALTVVPSTRPIAVPAADSVIAKRGQTTSIDVLANDDATNPFPSVPLRVIAVRGIDGGSLPAGLTLTPSADRSRLNVSAAQNAAAVDTNVQYEVADATGDSSRYAWGTVRISVQDKPDAVANLRAAAFGDRSITMAWDPGAFNNSPITDYLVTVKRSDTGEIVGTTACAATTCAVQTPGNGPAFGVRISVAARNAIGISQAREFPDALWSDVVPAAPVALSATPLDHGLRVNWSRPADVAGASAISSYIVTVGGVSTTVNVSRGDAAGTGYSANLSDSGIANGAQVTYSMTARNDYYGGTLGWNHADGTAVPVGAPAANGTPSATGDPETGTVVNLAWGGIFDGNGTAVIAYYVAAYTANAPSCSVSGVTTGNPQLHVDSQLKRVTGDSTTIEALTSGRSYAFIVYAYNGQGCTAATPVSLTTHKKPGTPSSVSTDLVASSDYTWDYKLNSVAYRSDGSAVGATWNYRLTGDFATESGSMGGPGFLGTSTAHYGKKAQVSVQVCESYRDDASLCSDWSAAFALGVPVSTAVGGLSYGAASHEFQWTSWPTGYTSVGYACAPGATPEPMPAAGAVASCQASGVFGGDTLTITVVSGAKTYRGNYAGGAYAK